MSTSPSNAVERRRTIVVDRTPSNAVRRRTPSNAVERRRTPSNAVERRPDRPVEPVSGHGQSGECHWRLGGGTRLGRGLVGWWGCLRRGWFRKRFLGWGIGCRCRRLRSLSRRSRSSRRGWLARHCGCGIIARGAAAGRQTDRQHQPGCQYECPTARAVPGHGAPSRWSLSILTLAPLGGSASSRARGHVATLPRHASS